MVFAGEPLGGDPKFVCAVWFWQEVWFKSTGFQPVKGVGKVPIMLISLGVIEFFSELSHFLSDLVGLLLVFALIRLLEI